MVVLALVLATILPPKGVLVPHESLAGVRLGDTPAAVRSTVGTRYTVCSGCPRPTWFYFEGSRETGLGVTFRRNRVSAVYTLGSPRGWTTVRGIKIGGAVETMRRAYGGRLRVTPCLGYVAHSDRRPGSVTTFFSLETYVTGFSLTLPAEPVCR
jgi:hypothetical protein